MPSVACVTNEMGAGVRALHRWRSSRGDRAVAPLGLASHVRTAVPWNLSPSKRYRGREPVFAGRDRRASGTDGDDGLPRLTPREGLALAAPRGGCCQRGRRSRDLHGGSRVLGPASSRHPEPASVGPARLFSVASDPRSDYRFAAPPSTASCWLGGTASRCPALEATIVSICFRPHHSNRVLEPPRRQSRLEVSET